MDQQEEMCVKHDRIKECMSERGLDAVVLSARQNFAWLTCGKLNYVVAARQEGVASLVVGEGRISCLTNNIERPRIEQEELGGLGIEFVDYLWSDGGAQEQAMGKLVGGSKVGYDAPVAGLPEDAVRLDFGFDRLRWSLLEPEIERYKESGRAAVAAMETTIGELKPGMSENEIAGVLAGNVYAQSARPWVILVAVDERISKYRHPIPTDAKLEKIAMVVLCAEKFGLICSLTRIVSFAPIDGELRRKHDAVVKVDAAMNLSSEAGKTLGEMLEVAKATYAEVGFPDEWRLHHQGGPGGYQPRDCLATEGNTTKLVPNQALAWNPSITGTKSEDTIITTAGDPIMVTAPSSDWPMIEAEYDGRTLARPDILVVD